MIIFDYFFSITDGTGIKYPRGIDTLRYVTKKSVEVKPSEQ